jgi:hypothetical protein
MSYPAPKVNSVLREEKKKWSFNIDTERIGKFGRYPAGLSPQRSMFAPGSVHVGFVWKK